MLLLTIYLDHFRMDKSFLTAANKGKQVASRKEAPKKMVLTPITKTQPLLNINFAEGNIIVDMTNPQNRAIFQEIAKSKSDYKNQYQMSKYGFSIINAIWKNTGGLQGNPDFISSIRKLDEHISSMESNMIRFNSDREEIRLRLSNLEKIHSQQKMAYYQNIIPFVGKYLEKEKPIEQLKIISYLSNNEASSSGLEKRKRIAFYEVLKEKLPSPIFDNINTRIFTDEQNRLLQKYENLLERYKYSVRIAFAFDQINEEAILAIEQGMVSRIIATRQQIMEMNFPNIIKAIVKSIPLLLQTVEISISSTFPEICIGGTSPSLQIWQIFPQCSYALEYVNPLEKEEYRYIEWHSEQKNNIEEVLSFQKFPATIKSWCNGRIMVIDRSRLSRKTGDNNILQEELLGPISQDIWKAITGKYEEMIEEIVQEAQEEDEAHHAQLEAT